MPANKFQLVLSTQAVQELQHIAEWYEEKAPYLGNRFLEAVNGGLKKIAERPTAFAHHKTAKIRRYLLPHFPYKIFYLIEGADIRVLAIIHTSRSKQYIRKRLK